MRGPARTPNEIGSALETRAAKETGGRRITQSGGGRFWKLDIRMRNVFVWSCKGKDKAKDSIRITDAMWREAKRAARGMRGSGDDVRPGLIIELDDELVALVPLGDLMEAYTGAPEPLRASTKAQERRASIGASRLGSNG